MTKKLLSMLLAIAMVVSMFAGLATTASAASYTWTRVTSIDTLKAGGQFIIGYEETANSGVIIPMANTGSASLTAAGFMYSGSTAASGDKTTIDMNTYSQEGSAFVVTIAESAVTRNSVTVHAADGYIGNANTKNNVKLFAEDSAANGTAYTVAMGANNVFTLKNANAKYHTLSYNSGAPRFACYGGTQKNVVIYQRSESDAPACEHANTEEHAEVAATCTEVGYTAGVFCTDCQTYISGHETIAALDHAWNEGVETLAATCTAAGEMTYTCTREGCGATKTEATPLAAHNYVDNVCSVCGTVDPTSVDYTGLYYISVDNTYMTSNLTTSSTQRYEAVATGLAEGESLPASITLTAADEKTFSIEKQEDGSYVIRAASVDGDNYLTYVSNAGKIGAADAAIKVSIVKANGIFKISNDTVDSTATRYLAKNNNAANMYYGWYKSGQHDTLSLIPVTIDAEAHVHTYAWDGNVGVDGSHTLVCECGEASMQEACADAEPVHTAGDCKNYGSTAYTCDVCGYTWTVADTEFGAHNYVDGICTLCGAEKPADQNYVLATGAIAEGDYVIYYDGKAMNTTVASNRLQYLEVTPVNNTITNPDAAIVWHIAPSGDYWTIYNAAAKSYAAATGTKNQATMNADGTVDKSLWTITGEGTFEFVNKSNAAAGINANLRNNGTYGFACYGTGTGGALTLYKLVEEVITDCQHTATEGTYVCNNDGTHTYTCSKCGESVTENCTAEEVETIPATCTSYSSTDYECSVCGGTWTVIGTEYAPHTYENGVCSVCGDALDKYVKVTDVSTLAAGDTVVIYYPASNMALTSTASGSKLAGVAGQIDTTGNGMMYVDGAAAMTVAINEAGQYQFSIVDAESNTLYLTSGATGNSLTFAAAPADGATDYTLWTIVADTTDSTIAYIKSVNATYNSNAQALEYHYGFTTYGEKTTAAYQFNFYKPYVEGEHVHSYTSEVTTAATCLTEGLKTYTCACGNSYTEAIPATGHSYAADAVAGTACANGCGHTLIEAKKTVALEDGMTVIFYSASISMAMDSVANGAYLNAIAPNTAAGDTLLIDDGVALMTIEVVEGGYRFKLGDNYLSYRGGRNTLVFEPLTDAVVTDETAGTTTDYTVFAVENGNALYCVNGDYDYNGNVNKLYLEAYGSAGTERFTTYNCSDNTGVAFVFTFYTTSEVCNHVADAGTVTTEATCTEPGVKTYTCTICGKVLYTEEIPATGHNYVDGVCTNCGEAEPNFEGDWYIAAIRASGNYFYMKNTMQNTAGTRFTAVDSGLTALPEAITEGAMPEYVFHIAKNADGSYVMYSNYVEGDNKYVGWNGGTTNTATLVAEANARAFTVIKNNDGTVKLELIKSADETTAEAAARYFSMNGTNNNNYFAWYKSGQRSDLTLIPVSGEIHVHSFTTESARVDATCTTDGSVTYTCSCGKTYTETVPATGHTIELVEAVAATCTTDGNDAYYKCSKCDAIFSDAEGTTALNAIPTVPATGHTEVTDAAVAPTCTETGLTAGSHCSVCGAVIVAQEVVNATGHSYTYTDNGDGTHTVGCANCDYNAVEDHTFTDGTCVCGAVEVTDPTYVESLSFLTSSVSLGASLNRLYVVRKTTVSAYNSFYVEIEKDVWNGEPVTYRFDDLSVYTESSAAYTLKFENISAKEMGDEFRATIHAFDADGNEYYGPAMVSSMEGYLKNVLRNGTTAAQIKMKPLCVDMLNYGAAAQNYFEYNTANLVNADLTEEELALGTVSTPTYENIYAVTDTGNPITVQAKAASFGSKVNMNVIFNVTNYTGDYNDLVYKVIDENGDVVATGGVTVSGTTRKTCTVKFDDVAAKKMRQTYRTGLYVGDTLVSAVQVWSIESYVATVMEGTSYKQTMKDLAIATLIYGDAAASYLAS